MTSWHAGCRIVHGLLSPKNLKSKMGSNFPLCSPYISFFHPIYIPTLLLYFYPFFFTIFAFIFFFFSFLAFHSPLPLLWATYLLSRSGVCGNAVSSTPAGLGRAQ